MKVIRRAAARVRAFLHTPLGRRLEHLAIVFLSTAAVTAVFNGKHLLDAHGLSALASAAPALATTALYAGWQKIRPLIPADVVACLHLDGKQIAKVAANSVKKQ